ncbi:MAG: hypothetical protein JNL71_07315 [Rhodospirillales bacterium]|nr:hypothetical protein [Rhodospirillales bacterium]
MLNVAPLLLRALLAVPPPAFARHAEAHDNAPAPVAPAFALVAAGYGFGPLRDAKRQAAKPKDPRRGRRK